MHGAPEGKIVAAVMLQRHELAPFVSFDAALTALTFVVGPVLAAKIDGPAADGGGGEGGGAAWAWFEQFDAVTALRRLLVCPGGPTVARLVPALVRGLDRAIRSPRSAVAKVRPTIRLFMPSHLLVHSPLCRFYD